jgi:hypothetical protein
MTFLMHWILAAGTILAVAGLILRAINRRKDAVPLPAPPRIRPEAREPHPGS